MRSQGVRGSYVNKGIAMCAVHYYISLILMRALIEDFNGAVCRTHDTTYATPLSIPRCCLFLPANSVYFVNVLAGHSWGLDALCDRQQRVRATGLDHAVEAMLVLLKVYTNHRLIPPSEL